MPLEQKMKASQEVVMSYSTSNDYGTKSKLSKRRNMGSIKQKLRLISTIGNPIMKFGHIYSNKQRFYSTDFVERELLFLIIKMFLSNS